MTAHEGGAQVSVVETFAQPHDVDEHGGLNSVGNKALRLNLVIAGDSKALEVVRTVHSPRASPSRPSFTFPSSELRKPSVATPIKQPEECIVQKTTTTVATWRTAWRDKMVTQGWWGQADFWSSLLVIIYTIQYYGQFLKWHESRSDIEGFAMLSDPILPYMEATDLSIPLFVMAYGSIFLMLWYTFDKPNVMIELAQTNTLVILVRMVTLYLTPLEAPRGTIPLVDPIAHADGIIFVRDLFFSGHTATTFIAFIICRREHLRWKLFFLAMTVATACMVVLQKTHYAIDVFAAPFFVYTAHGCVQELRKTVGSLLTSSSLEAPAVKVKQS
ncbi:TPA: hypothetical protein N0F65_011045 [Lagenidium giganteum]|uniref:Sphingomyelin synthase-like domain-containing protein n=1 Tax=Lagenidium giganteum TaxID=4803 RepID=A0AAV2ZHS7_9STRA|nr:TPA: hypothetical protein N0F65_011045 [Lagenidium giganteum]